MKKLTKLQWIQLISSVLMSTSTCFVIVVTYVHLIKISTSKEYRKSKYLFSLAIFLTGAITLIGTAIINTKIMSNQYLILNMIATIAITVLSNYVFVIIQQKITTVVSNSKQEAPKDEDMSVDENASVKNKPRNKKMNIVIIIVAGAVVTVLSIGALIGFFIKNVDQSAIPDQNGEDNTALAVLTESDVIHQTSQYVSKLSGERRAGGESQITDRTLSAYDSDYLSFSCDSISGVKTLMATKTDKDVLVITIESTLEAGNMELFVIVDGAIYQNVPVNDVTTVKLDGIEGQTVLVKLAGESAKCHVVVSREMQ